MDVVEKHKNTVFSSENRQHEEKLLEVWNINILDTSGYFIIAVLMWPANAQGSSLWWVNLCGIGQCKI